MNPTSAVLSLLARMSAVAAIGLACVRMVEHLATVFVMGRGDATAFVMGHLKMLGHVSLDLAALSRDVLAFFGAT
jgi:hypothetical protein